MNKYERDMHELMTATKAAWGGQKLPPPPWAIEDVPATFATAWQCARIELDRTGLPGLAYGELWGYLKGLLAARFYNNNHTA